MLARSLLIALAAGLAFEGLAGPVARDASLSKRVVPATHNLHERHASHWGRKWTKRDRVDAEVVLPMRIGLKQYNIDAGHDKLMDISNPKSANYGKHMTPEEVIDFFAPDPSSVDTVLDWLVASGISKDRIGLSVNKQVKTTPHSEIAKDDFIPDQDNSQWIQFDAMTGEVEELLFADYHVWEDVDGNIDISAEAYHLPALVQDHVDYVTPGTRLRSRNEAKRTKMVKRDFGSLNDVKPFITELAAFPNPNSTTCSTYVTADCTRVQYNLPNGTTSTPGNELGIFESLDDHYSKHDLDVFFSTLYPYMNIPNGTYPEERLIDGAIGSVEEPSPVYPLETGLESMLDFDSAWPLIYPQKTVLYQVDDEYYEYTGNFSGFWNTFLDALDGSYCTYSAYGETGDCVEAECADPVYPDLNPGGYTGALQCGVYEPTNVISISYGADEAYYPDFYMKRQCNEWMKLVLQGTTVVMSSGDSGVGESGYCPTDELGDEVFSPDFASSCPYILSVGSTEWDRYSNATTPQPWEKLNEVATARFPSGGGFSNVFAQPEYQKDAVNSYLDTVGSTLPFTSYDQFVPNGEFSNITDGKYNGLGRAYPDVGAVGDRQVVYANGSWYLVGGTSLSSPVWGAVLTLLNEERLTAGKSTVGYIHPVLYSHPEVFNDVTSGSNPGCSTTGFPAAAGWDPVTGLGSPNFPKLLEVLMSI
ncbi:Uu.00g132040.m01.CDS01 [Anthostomella pinea]|uniref:Uu.00g132040.m01.CDS01 n=1 Tax=Anthostomella pinea TaxID=933095 RepID=A0AAI8VIZ5_9PEZI|nr:Uu.00g132040.m01.CDS01 [Anthostomella pinea]